MKKTTKVTLLSMLSLLTLSACGGGGGGENIDYTKVDKNKIAFTAADIVQESFGGLGVEWGAYEDTDKLIEGGWEKVLRHMDHLGAARIRLMINYDWFCQNFDNHGTLAHEDDTWTYNFNNKYARSMLDILEYCETHDIDVAFGAWNVIGNLYGDVWGMMEEVTSDIRWAKITADVLDFLVNKKGFSCIKWFVNSNEPNLVGTKDTSKNWNNTYEIWEQGVKNVRKALDQIGLSDISIVGGDTTGFEDSDTYLTNIAKNIPDKVGDYGIHLYLSNFDIDRGVTLEQVRELYSNVKKRDKKLGVTRQMNIWEAGLKDGKTTDDRQALITTANYAVRMMDFTLQCLAGGINGIVYWDFDDAMHFMYDNETVTPKEWGMFSSLAEASSGMQELRPWYHSSSLLCHLLKKGNKVYSPLQNHKEVNRTFRSLATVSPDGKQGGFVAVNAGASTEEKTFYMHDPVEGDKLYVYIFNAESYRLDGEGYIEPNYVIDGSLNKKFTISIPRQTGIVVSNTRL